MSLLDLRRKRGEPWVADLWNRHLEEISRYLDGLGIVTATGNARRAAAGTIYLPLSVAAGAKPGEWLLRVGFGLLGGLEPKINGQRVSETDPDTGDTPALTATAAAFSTAPDKTGDWPKGTCFVYGVANFDKPSWAPLSPSIVARATPWTVTPWKAARLIGVLQRDDPDDEASNVSSVQLTAFNQALTLSKKNANGTARYWWKPSV